MFDPTKFGGDPAACRYGARKSSESRSRFVSCKGNDGSPRVNLYITGTDAAEMRRLFGEGASRVCVCPVPQEGAILVWPDDGSGAYATRTPSVSNKAGALAVSIESMSRIYFDRFGTFRHVYLTMQEISGGEAVKFSPNGMRD